VASRPGMWIHLHHCQYCTLSGCHLQCSYVFWYCWQISQEERSKACKLHYPPAPYVCQAPPPGVLVVAVGRCSLCAAGEVAVWCDPPLPQRGLLSHHHLPEHVAARVDVEAERQGGTAQQWSVSACGSLSAVKTVERRIQVCRAVGEDHRCIGCMPWL